MKEKSPPRRPAAGHRPDASTAGPGSSQEALHLTNLGVELFNKGQHQKAFDAFQKAYQMAPEVSTLSSNLGAALISLKKLEEALTVLRRAHEQSGTDAALLVNLGVTYGEKGEKDREIIQYQAAINEDPKLKEAYLNLGVAYMDQGQAEKGAQAKANASVARAIELYPKSSEAHLAMGLVLELQKDFPQALVALDRALELSSRSQAVMLHRADVLAVLGRRQEAIKAYQDLLNHNRELPQAHISLSEVLLAEGRADEARESAVRAVEMELSDLFLLRKLGKLLIDLNLGHRALEVFDRVLTRDPKDHETAHAMGQIYSRQREYDKAVDCFEKAFRIDPRYSKASYNLAMIHYTRGHYDLARKVLDLTLKADAKHLKAWNLLAKTWLKQGQPKLALEAWEQALAIRPNSSSLLKSLIKVSAELDDKPRMTKYYTQAKALKAEREKERTAGDTTFADEDDEIDQSTT
ncbi:MAG: tetratricopeptide repeat protein [Candidatus Riflebacteria bacterium]|nr:tetratricopeptide repeat protein [Candidatus Riflebacteria bacterium]